MTSVESYGQSESVGVPLFLERVRTRYERQPGVYHEMATLFAKLGQHQLCVDEVVQHASDLLADDPELMHVFGQFFPHYPAGPAIASPSVTGLDAEFDDAKEYIYRVKRTFLHRPQVYESFVAILYAYHSSQIDVDQVNQHINALLRNYPSLLASFKQFLPHRP